MSTILLLVLGFASVLVDIGLAPGATLLGVRPQLTVVVVALWAVLRPQVEVMLLAPAAGVFLGLLGNEPLGVSVLALAPIVVLGGVDVRRPAERRFVRSIALIVAGTLAYALAHAFLSRVAGQPFPLGAGSAQKLAGLCLANALMGVVLYWPLARIAGDSSLRDEPRRY